MRRLKLRLVSWQSLLHDPNPNSPANNEAAILYRENRREYEKKVQLIVAESWDDDIDDDDQAQKPETSSKWVSNDDQSQRFLPLFLRIHSSPSLQSLLDEPNPKSPANNEAAQLFESNKREYKRRVKEIVELSWIFVPSAN